MNPEILKGFAQIGFFVGGGGLLLLLLEPRGSSEWVISLCSALLGGLILLGVVGIQRWTR